MRKQSKQTAAFTLRKYNKRSYGHKSGYNSFDLLIAPFPVGPKRAPDGGVILNVFVLDIF